MKKRELVKIKNVSKKFIRHEKYIWSLKGVNIALNRGEIVGLYGDNGCGKTTILKLIAGILQPDKGKVEINGEIATVMELGAGLHYELSGFDNIYLYGSILGISKNELDKIIGKIIKFSGLKEFINQPIKQYSSGMKARLAFAIVIHLKADIFLLDEVMAVGDSDFKQKCIKAIIELKKRVGLMIASHNLGMLLKVCDRIITLDKGEIVSGGNVDDKLTKNFVKQVINNQGFEVKALSSSMEPVIKKGDKIEIIKAGFSKIKAGDIIAFTFKPLSNFLIHRVVAITNKDGKRKFITKGDASSVIDSWLIGKENFIGKIFQ